MVPCLTIEYVGTLSFLMKPQIAISSFKISRFQGEYLLNVIERDKVEKNVKSVLHAYCEMMLFIFGILCKSWRKRNRVY
jgi:hypothetical protein